MHEQVISMGIKRQASTVTERERDVRKGFNARRERTFERRCFGTEDPSRKNGDRARNLFQPTGP